MTQQDQVDFMPIKTGSPLHRALIQAVREMASGCDGSPDIPDDIELHAGGYFDYKNGAIDFYLATHPADHVTFVDIKTLTQDPNP